MIERLRQLDRAAVKVSCNKLCESVVNCVKTSYLDLIFNRSVLAIKTQNAASEIKTVVSLSLLRPMAL